MNLPMSTHYLREKRNTMPLDTEKLEAESPLFIQGKS